MPKINGEELPNGEVQYIYQFQNVKNLNEVHNWFVKMTLLDDLDIKEISLFDPSTFFETGNIELEVLANLNLAMARKDLIRHIENTGATSISVIATYKESPILMAIDIEDNQNYVFAIEGYKEDDNIIAALVNILSSFEVTKKIIN